MSILVVVISSALIRAQQSPNQRLWGKCLSPARNLSKLHNVFKGSRLLLVTG